MLRAEHVPKIVQDAMKNKLYRKVSIELDIGVEHKGKKYAYVLSGVALLGADLPAVNTLKDLDHYISGESRLAASRRAEFSAIDGLGKHETKEFTMDEKKLQEMMDASIAKAVEPLKNQLAEKDSQLAKFTRDEEARASAEKATKIKTARDSAKAILEEGVKLGAITPGQREMFTKTLGIEDDAKVVLIEPEDLRKLIGAASSKFSKDETRQASEKVERKFPDDPGAELDYRVREALSKDSKLSYSTAYQHELRRDPELAREHANS